MPGRNDPCPCGSGKKFKKCCLAREDDLPDPDQPIPGMGGRTLRDLLGDPKIKEQLLKQLPPDARFPC